MKTHFADDETLAELKRLQEENQRLVMALADAEALELGTSERCGKLMEELSAANERYQRAIRLGQDRIASRDLVIEQMRAALTYVNDRVGFSDEESADKWFSVVGGALALQPSTEALAYRDRKRDAVLLRKLADNPYAMFSAGSVRILADKRESGEWEPKLEEK